MGADTPKRQSLSRELSSTEKSHHVQLEAAVEALDPVEEKKIRRKIDWRLIPILQLMYMLTFLDRVNIGNARVWNLEEDLNTTGFDYNIAVLVFYIPYILFEVPANMIFHRCQPRKFMATILMCWGLVVTFVGFTKSFAGLTTARVLIGVFEAGMFPGCMFLISRWYRRHEVLTRMAFFFVANDIAGTISGLLGAGLGSLHGAAGYSGWCWIFFVEGAMTCTVAVIAWFTVPPFPEDATFLSPEEKAWVLRRLSLDSQGVTQEKMTKKGVFQSLTDWKIQMAAVMYLAVCTTAYAISVFQPTILRTFGWDGLKSNLLSAPPRLASAFFSVGVGIWSDKVKRRGPFMIGGYVVSCVGLILVMALDGAARYAGIYLAAIGIYICQPMVIAWCVNQVVGSTKRGTVTAYAGSWGQVGGIVSAVAYPESTGPKYVPGIMTCVGLNIAGIACAAMLWGFCAYENKQRAAGKRDYLRELPQEAQDKLGEKHPDFRYTL